MVQSYRGVDPIFGPSSPFRPLVAWVVCLEIPLDLDIREGDVFFLVSFLAIHARKAYMCIHQSNVVRVGPQST